MFADGTAFRSFLGVVATALEAAGGAAGAAGKGMTSVLGLLPSDQMLDTEGLTTDNSSTVTTTFTSTTTIGTTPQGGGPGVGDTIVYFQDVLVAWAYNGGSLQLCPIGWNEALVTAAKIQNDPGQLGIATSDQQLLLSLDPFVAGGPFAQPPADRFTQPPEADLPASITYGGGSTFNHQYAVTRDNKTISSTKSYTTDTNTFSPGEILQMFGVGTSKSQVTTTLTTATTGDVSQTVTLGVNLVSGPDDIFVVTIWYDSLFGYLGLSAASPDRPAGHFRQRRGARSGRHAPVRRPGPRGGGRRSGPLRVPRTKHRARHGTGVRRQQPPDDGGCCRSDRSVQGPDQRAAAVQGMTRPLPLVVPGLNVAKDD